MKNLLFYAYFLIKRISVLYILVISFSTFAYASEILTIKSVYFKKVKDGIEKVVFKLNKSTPPDIFPIEGGKMRLVCDFKNAKLGKGVDGKINTNGKLIISIRIGFHPLPGPKVRAVLDLIPNQNYDIQPLLFQEEKIFEVLIRVGNKE